MPTANARATDTLPEPPAKGSRWRLRRDVMRFPHFTARAGLTGVVSSDPDDYNICLRIDAHLPGAEEWDNDVCWAPEDAMEQDCAAFAFLADCERVTD